MRSSTQISPSIKAERKLYYTNNIKWIGLYKQGDEIGCLSYHDYTIYVQMPVDGSIGLITETLLSGDNNIVVEQPESKGCIAEIFPASPYNCNGLLDYDDCRMKQYKGSSG